VNKYDKEKLSKLIKYLNKNECGATTCLVLINKITKDPDKALKIMEEQVNWYTNNS
jgi:hypothetical protein|tara:strand:+ start:9657 stop:9824 length:168 start_codon:yes stop_codon:yes gene_type:complete